MKKIKLQFRPKDVEIIQQEIKNNLLLKETIIINSQQWNDLRKKEYDDNIRKI